MCECFLHIQHAQGTQPPVKPQVSKVQQKFGDSSAHRILSRHRRLRNSTLVCCGLDSPVERPTQIPGARTKHWLQDVESNLAKVWLPHFLPLSSTWTLMRTCKKRLAWRLVSSALLQRRPSLSNKRLFARKIGKRRRQRTRRRPFLFWSRKA